MPYESICLLETQHKECEILGSKGKIFPGSEVHNFQVHKDEIEFEIHDKSLNPGNIFIKVSYKYEEYKVNGRRFTTKCIDDNVKIIEYII